jgi:hypothetical protein
MSQPIGALCCLVLTAFAWGTISKAATPDTAATAQISQTLDHLHEAAARADGAAYFRLFAADAVFIGTDATEQWPIAAFREYAMARFATGQGWTYTPRERHVTVAKTPCRCVAWFDELLDNVNYGTSRGVGVLINAGHGWKIEQYALTFPTPNDMAADITRQIKAFEGARGH